MKIGANEPCPCGSGKKYKRCCRSLQLDLEGPPDTSTQSPPPLPDTWEPLSRLPTHYLSLEESETLLTPRQQSFIAHLIELAQQCTPESLEQAQRRILSIPPAERNILHGLPLLHAQLFELQGKDELAFETLWATLSSSTSHTLWHQLGHFILKSRHLHQSPTPPSRLIGQLHQYIERHPDAPPEARLMLVQLYQHPPTPTLSNIATLAFDGLNHTKWTANTQNNHAWYPTLLTSFSVLVHDALQNGTHSKAHKIASYFTRCPWELAPTCGPHEANLLLQSLFQLGLQPQTKQLAQRFQRQNPDWGLTHYWLGSVLYNSNQRKKPKALRHFRLALAKDDLSALQRVDALQTCFEQLDDAELEQQLARIDEENTPPARFLRLMSLLRRNEVEAASALVAQCVQKFPEHQTFRFYQTLIWVHQADWAQAERGLSAIYEDPGSDFRWFAALFLGGLLASTHRPEDALALLQPLSEKNSPFTIPEEWTGYYHNLLAGAFEQLERKEEALEHYEKALALRPDPMLFQETIHTLLQLERFERADHITLLALEHFPDDPALQCSRLMLEERFERWEDVLALLQKLGFSWPKENGLWKETLQLWMRALLYHHGAMQALEFAEEHLPDILKEPDLTALRAQIFREVRSLYEQTQKRLGKQDKKLQQLEATKTMLTLQRDAFVQKHKHLAMHLQREKQQRQTLWLQQQSKALFGFSQPPPPHSEEELLRELQPLLPHLSPDAQALLKSAELLWHRLEDKPDEDHAPVILQLARVIEGEVNRLLLDPLISLALQNGISLSQLPHLSMGTIRPTANRISLGDASMLLYHRLERDETDGTKSTLINPRSNQTHKSLLEKFWQSTPFETLQVEEREHLQNRIPLQLQRLARSRNQAGHAGQPLGRKHAQLIRQLVLGTKTHKGLIQSLILLHTTTPNPPPKDVP